MFSVRRFVMKVSGVAAGLVGLLFLFNCIYPVGNKGTAVLTEEERQAHPEIPLPLSGRSEQIIVHDGFTLSYNADCCIANWAAYELTAAEARSDEVPRAANFLADPKVRGAAADNADYKGSGYDRGHLAPAGDMKWSRDAMQSSFYLTNICPQNRQLNAGLWNDLERQCRSWAVRYEALLVVTGPVVEEDMKRIGANRVAVPRRFFKVLCDLSGGKPRGIGFVAENRAYGKATVRSIALPIDSIESLTGITFFPTLSAEGNNTWKASVDWKHWFFWRGALD